MAYSRNSTSREVDKDFLIAYLLQQQESYSGILLESQAVETGSESLAPVDRNCNHFERIEIDGPERSRSSQNELDEGSLESKSLCGGDERSESLRSSGIMNREIKTVTSRRNRVFASNAASSVTNETSPEVYSNVDEASPEIHSNGEEASPEVNSNKGDKETSPELNCQGGQLRELKQPQNYGCLPLNDDIDQINDDDLYSSNDLRFSSSGNQEDISREVDELLRIGTINKKQADNMRDKKDKQVHLNSIIEWRKQDNSEIGMRPFHFDVDGIPLNWTENSASELDVAGVNYQLVDLHPGQVEYEMINDEFEAAGLRVSKIERLQNMYLLDRFKSEMEEVKRRQSPDFDLNVRYLYHGTMVEKRRICEEGLDQRLSRMGFFGKGIYFSDNPMKCVGYAQTMDNIGQAYILKCRVILGDCKCYPKGENDTSLKREPEKANCRPGTWRYYDSVLGCPKDYNEFVVYENRRAMIEYIIFFNQKPNGFTRSTMLRAKPPTPAAIAIGESNRPVITTETNISTEADSSDEDDHLQRLQQVREAVRQKRCVEKGIPYVAPSHDKLQKDMETWSRIQKLHKGPDLDQEVGLQASQELSSDNQLTSNLKPPEGADNYFYETSLYDEGYLQGGDNFVISTDPDPVDEVMSELIQEFIMVTGSDNVETAKYYLEKAQMNVNNAIVMYYDDMP